MWELFRDRKLGGQMGGGGIERRSLKRFTNEKEKLKLYKKRKKSKSKAQRPC